MRKYLPQYIPEGEIPTIKLLHDIRGDLFATDTRARAGEYKAYMNRYGAVSVIADNGKRLGVLPHEMEWISGKPSKWCKRKKGITFLIEPYAGDWTLEAAEKAANA
ncbi:hypothetical protein [Maridesulfovibrio ferrireducens]|uniref:hypothetical protein n=1 Tax=Maridesulfovibrio ferrireducens TaxID=246191 RepID=UPI001A317142|nr:hypothetical protein [Maridesulfovibrio ferrireducens]MBI9112220.1 hypothetical protein [Maridesulfovibrio ferrireducens]